LPPPPTPAFDSHVIGLLFIVFCRPLLSLLAVMQPSTLLLPDALAANCRPPPPPLPLPLLLPPFVFGRWCQVYHPI
jgi:hypothetical protein